MTSKSKKTIFPAFGHGFPSQTASEAQLVIDARYNAFFGAVFNSLDSHFRMGCAQGLPENSYDTGYHIKEDSFLFVITTKRFTNDSGHNSSLEAYNFFKAIYDISSENELYSLSATVKEDASKNEVSYYLHVTSPLELMELIENLLKQYEFDDFHSPTLRFSDPQTNQGLSFSLFPQYAIQHIRAMLHRAQGRPLLEGSGLHLSH
jgi:hypothetical protein